jgi:L-asparaginase
MLPAIHKDSDALFNIGTAVGAIDHLGPGVFIAMSGKIFSWRECIKISKSIK